jgi:2-amino-4-hydroxy-6-hydroxymethyldihydropteridine diphosphokinase
MTTAWVALGSNVESVRGSPTETIALALLAIKALPGVELLAASSVHITKPDHAMGDDFANAVCKIETSLDAFALLHALQQIEIDFGRPAPDSAQRSPHALPGASGLKPARTLDLDLLLYGEGRIQSQTLTVPHPRMHERPFVMLPLAEIANL